MTQTEIRLFKPASAKGAPYAAGFFPFADTVDTLTEATLVFTFL